MYHVRIILEGPVSIGIAPLCVFGVMVFSCGYLGVYTRQKIRQGKRCDVIRNPSVCCNLVYHFYAFQLTPILVNTCVICNVYFVVSIYRERVTQPTTYTHPHLPVTKSHHHYHRSNNTRPLDWKSSTSTSSSAAPWNSRTQGMGIRSRLPHCVAATSSRFQLRPRGSLTTLLLFIVVVLLTQTGIVFFKNYFLFEPSFTSQFCAKMYH